MRIALQKIEAKYYYLIAISLLTFLVYAFTACPYPSGYADSDELIALGYSLGVNHPPGYPLITLLTYLATHIPFPISIALRANLLNVLLQTLTVSMVFLTALELLSTLFAESKKRLVLGYCAAAACALTLAFSFLFWSYSTVLEVFSLNNLFAIMLVFIALKIRKASTFPTKHWLCFTGTLGLALAHHQTIVLLLPGLAFLLLPYFFSVKPKLILKNRGMLFQGIILLFLTFTVSYSLLFILRISNAPFSWNFEPTVNGIVRMITRKEYAEIHTVDGIQTGAYYTGFYLPENVRAFKEYLTVSLPNHFGLPALGLMLSGLIILLIKGKGSLRLSFLSFITCCCFFPAFYLTLLSPGSRPLDYYQVSGLTERMYLMGYVLLSLTIPIAIYGLLSLVKNRVKAVYLGIGILILPLYLVLSNFSAVNMRQYSSIADYVHTALDAVEPEAIVICFSDISCFSLFYAQAVENYRPDVTVIPVTPQFQTKEYSPISYEENPFRIAGIISWQLHQGKAVYLAEVNSYYLWHLGLDGSTFHLESSQNLLKVTYLPDLSKNLSSPDLELVQHSPDPRQKLQHAFRAMLSEHHQISALTYAIAGNTDQAQKEIALAKTLADNPLDELFQTINSFEKGLTPTLSCKTSEYYLEKAKTCGDDYGCVYKNYYQASLLDPKNISIRLSLARLYKENGYNDLAAQEYGNVLALDPGNFIAKTELGKLPPIDKIDRLHLY